jgi:hypothetical protein
MSGGTINFTNNTFVDASYRYQVFNIQVQPGNYTITGGTVNVNLPSSATVYTANSSVPFYNMNITNRTGSGTMTVQMTAIAPNLAILNDLSIGNGALLDMNTNTIGLNVGRNFNLAAGATYTPGTNTTTFNGSGVQTFTNTGTITSGLNNFTLSNASNTSITSDLTVRGTITIGSSCSLNDQGFTINAAGNISNSGTHNSQANGSILLNGSSAQTLGGSGSGVFGNLGINKTSGTATLTIGQSISGNLRLVNGILTIGSFNLKLSATSSIYDALTGTAAPTTFGDSKMIKTTGDASDGGVTRSFNATGSFFYPVGTTTYHPASISFSDAPTSWGDVTVKPVAVVHPSADPLYEALKYYWKVTSNSITGILPGSVSHIYYYKVADVTTTDDQYITGVYNPFTWTKGATEQVDIINKKIHFPAVQILDGEYTAGLPNAFGVVKVYYSRANGDWSTASTWSNVSHASGVASTAPGPNDLVVIGDGGSYNHVVTMSSNTQIVSGLQLSAGSTLDLNTTTGHNFGTVTGPGAGYGTLRISSSVTPAVFPSGDFGNFLGSSGGTVEYYTETAPGNIGVAFTMPTTYLTGSNTINIANYNNLIISPATGKNITLPNTNLLIYKDLKVSVSGTSVTGIAQLNNQSTSRTITINGNLNVNNGNFQFTNGNSTSQNVTVIGDVTVASGATFDVAANLTATNTLSIQGNLTNNGIFDMIAGATQVCNVTFTGVVSKQINGTTATRTDFNILTVNKGVDRTSMLEVTVNALTLNTSLASAITLTNGTFRLSNSNLAITLSTTSPFTIPGTGCLSANIGTINIGAANNNAADLLLQGRLEVMSSGIVNIGNGGGSSNDIEYASSGNPEINISGGSLNVDGQIRRNISNNAGSLIYNQTGGTVTVKGNSFDTTRGMFELLNAGSQFNVSGGNLIIVNAGIVAMADVYLEPGSSTVNGSNGGHTLTLGNGSTPASQVFNLNTTAPLWNLTVDGSTNNKTANLSINSLSILNNLTINGNGNAGTGSVFKANELNVTIGGSLINNNLSSGTGVAAGGYQAGTTGSTQNTTFTGTGTITGTGSNLTNFANLVIGSMSTTPSITLSSNSNLRVNNNLTLTSGTIADAGNTITILGNIINSAIHSSPLAPGGGILLANNVKQVITTTGNGKLGNVTVNNASGADVIGDSWITGQLTLTSGLLYINDYKLTMDVNASFGGTFDVNRMVALNGANSDKGVMKYFTGTTSNFVFPIGSSGKYRPVTYSFTSSNAGSIIVIPVNTAHPSVFDPTNDQLNYYWKTTISGFSGVSAITQVYQYGAIEVTGNESAYIGARFSGSLWVQYSTGSINATSHTITVNDLVTGDYTAGVIDNFGTVHKLYSLSSGDWNSTSIWAEDSPTNPACGYYPNGNPVFIQPGHTITMNINSASAASVDIQGIFDLKQTSFHSLGDITDTLHTGAGKLMIEASADGMYLFAGANYDRFMASTGTTVELYGSIDAQMPLKPGNISKPYQNLILTGTGIKYMSAETLKILGNLTINIGAKLSDILFNKELYILGNWTDLNTSPATGGFVPGTGLVSFEGSSAQTLTVTNAGITETFYDFRMNNPAGVTIAGGGNAQISNNLTLTSGTITTNTTNSLTLTNFSTSAVTGGSVTSYINGPLRKQINNGSFFNFPVGKPSPSPRYGQVYLSGVVTSGIWEAEYFNGSPNSNSPSLTITSMLTPVVSVSNNEYWRIKGVSSGSAYAKLRWDAGSGLSADPVDRDKTRVVEWNPSGTPRWENRGNVVTDNGQNSGFVETDNAISMTPGTDLHYLTIGSGSLPLPTATITSPLTAAICNNGVASATVTVALTGTAPWSLTYKLGAVSTTINNIASSPVSIVLTSTSSGITQPITSATDFNFNITNVNDFNGVAGISDYTTTVVLTVNQIPDNTITGRTLVGTGEIVAYTTPTDATTYAWTLSSNGTPLTGSSSTYTVTWGGASPGPYTIGLTKTTAAGCQVTNSISVTTSTTPSPVITGKQKVCAGSIEAYSTPSVSGHSYDWTVSANGTISSGAGTNSITITWGSVSINNIVTVRESVTATPAIYTDATRTVDIGIQPSSTAPSFVVSSPVCVGNAPSFTINNSQLNVRYQLRNNTDNSNSGSFVDGTGGTIVLTGSPIVANTTFNIYGYTLAPFDCGVQLSNPSLTATVVVTPIPIATFSYTASPYCSNAANPSPTFSGGGVAGTFSSTAGLVFVSSATGQINISASTAGTYTVTNTIAAAGGCSEVIATSSITITTLPVATFSYTGTPYCSNSANPSPTFSGGGVAGTFSSTAGLVFVSTATGQINISASTTGTYTVTNTIAAAGGCGIVTATTPVTINLNGSWTGSINTDWNTLGNWACNQLPGLTTDVIIATGKSNYPALFSGTDPGKCRNLTIQSSSSVTVSGETLQIAGTITNSGTFTATAGTVEMIGSGAQVIGAVFAGNTIMNLTINNSAGVTLQGTLSVTGIVSTTAGILSSGGNLTLVSTASQTALIDGTGSGSVSGDVTMQRYLSSALGYKYISSPFNNTTVNAFTTYINLSATFPTFYRYDENKVTAGWVSYTSTSGSLSPMVGYAANFGPTPNDINISITGVVNNGPMSISLSNNGKPYTQGFNLVGNPYPSPIDWDAGAGWTKTNIGAAIHFYNATDQYTGTYTHVVNGFGSSIIPSMQGFFVSVTNPGSATLVFANSVRVSNNSSGFSKSAAYSETRPYIRLTAGYADEKNPADPVIIYFDEKASVEFDSKLDALKLMNTDVKVPNFYALSADAKLISIGAIPYPDSMSVVPLGLKTEQAGWISFIATSIENMPSGLQIYFLDNKTGIYTDLLQSTGFKLNMIAGTVENRFRLIFSNRKLSDTQGINDAFVAYSSGGKLIVSFTGTEGEKGDMVINNMIGQELWRKQIIGTGVHEFDPQVKTGVYLVSFYSGKSIYSKKVLITNQ